MADEGGNRGSRVSGMARRRLLAFALASTSALAACSGGDPSPTQSSSGIIVADVFLPVAGAVYRGADSHRFLDESVTLFCGTHGIFTSSIEPPSAVGQSVLSNYLATFVGELVLGPPVARTPVTHTLNVQAQMAERITLSETRGASQIFDTELVAFELSGSSMPENIVVRESSDLVSTGVTTITAVSGGVNRVESHYDVWLEISLDGGRTWHQAQNAVRMTLEPS